MKTLPGKISITRPSNGQGSYINIRLTDEASGNDFLEATMTLEDFALAVTGFSMIPITMTPRRLDLIGYKSEIKTEKIILPDDYSTFKSDMGVADELLKPHEIDGWRGSRSDLFNTNRRDYKNNTVRVSFRRYVHPETGNPYIPTED